MNLLVPLGLLGLLTLPVILVLHLLRNRRELLPISSLRLWYGLQQKKQGRLPRSIPLTWMLLLQVLVVGALSLALARPVLSFLLVEPRQTIFILDTTTSMTAVENGPDLGAPAGPSHFARARQVIQSQLELMNEADTIALITLNARPEVVMAGEGAQKAGLLAVLNELVPGGTGLDLAAALTLANGQVDPDHQTEIFVLTDGHFLPEDQALPAMLAPVTWQLASNQAGASSVDNQALLNVSSRTLPDGRHRLFARVVNYSQAPVERSLRVLVDRNLFQSATVQLEPEAEVSRIWTLPAWAETAAIEIVEPDVLLLDNRADVLLRETAWLNVLLVSDTPEIMARALEAQPGVMLTVESPGLLAGEPSNLAARLAEFDLTVFEGLSFELTTWPRGNLWVINPPLGHPLLPAQNFVRNLRPNPASGSALLAGVDLSGGYFSRAPQVSLPAWAEQDLGGFPADGAAGEEHPLIFHGSVDNSRLVVWAFDLAESNLPARLALPLMTANTLSSLVAPALPQVVPLGEPVAISGNFSVDTPAGRRLFLASSEAGHPGNFQETRQPGLYRVYNDNNVLVAGFAVQAGSAFESNLLDPINPDRLRLAYIARQDETGSDMTQQEFWPWLAGLALLVITLEGWLAWRR